LLCVTVYLLDNVLDSWYKSVLFMSFARVFSDKVAAVSYLQFV